MSHAHDHPHAHSHRPAQQKAILLALLITAVFVVVELVAGIAFSSLALAADAAHLFSDGVALTIALAAGRIASRPASSTHSFGWMRAEVIAAQLNAVLLIGVALWIVVAAVQRIADPVDVDARGVIVVAALGLVGNLVSTWLLRRAPGENMNVRAAAMHTISDAAGSGAALFAGIVIALGGSDKVDPIASIAIAVLVLVAALRLLRDTTHVLLEATPPGLDPELVEKALTDDSVVIAVHHLHVWALAPGSLALSAHIELEGPVSLHDAQAEGIRLKAMLAERFGVGHSTLELECHPCETPTPRHPGEGRDPAGNLG